MHPQIYAVQLLLLCIARCHAASNNLQSEAKLRVLYYYTYYTYSCFDQTECTIGVIFGIIFTALLIICIAGISSHYKKRKLQLKKGQSIEKFDVDTQFMEPIFNKIDSAISQEQFEAKQKILVSAFQSAKDSQKEAFIYSNQYNRNFITLVSDVGFQKKKQFCVQVRFIAKDNVGTWYGKGFIVQRKEGTFFWMMKEYKDRQAAGQVGDFRYIIFESTQFHDEKGMKGQWYFDCHKNDPRYSGRWELSFEVANQQKNKKLVIESAANIYADTQLKEPDV